MRPYEACYLDYKRRVPGGNFSTLVGAYLQHGFVFSTPDFFALGKAVDAKHGTEDQIKDPAFVFPKPDAWYLAAFWGDAVRLWETLPTTGLALDRLAWYKWKLGAESLHVYPLSVLRRFYPPMGPA